MEFSPHCLSQGDKTPSESHWLPNQPLVTILKDAPRPFYSIPPVELSPIASTEKKSSAALLKMEALPLGKDNKHEILLRVRSEPKTLFCT